MTSRFILLNVLPDKRGINDVPPTWRPRPGRIPKPYYPDCLPSSSVHQPLTQISCLRNPSGGPRQGPTSVHAHREPDLRHPRFDNSILSAGELMGDSQDLGEGGQNSVAAPRSVFAFRRHSARRLRKNSVRGKSSTIQAQASPVLARKPSRRPARYCILLGQVLTSAVSWPMFCWVFKLSQTKTTGPFSCWCAASRNRAQSV